MATNDDKADAGRAVEAARPKARSTDRPFDMWLHKQLHAMYDEIASEPLPDDLVNLIEADAATSTKADASGKAPKK